MKRIAAIAVLLLASACSRGAAPSNAPSGNAATGLEAAAIEAGVIPDPNDVDITGLYARDTDRMCVMPSATAFRIGVFVDYGDQQQCGASGTATRDGEALRVEIDGAGGCAFDARYEGDRIVFPGRLPDACQKSCVGRASMSGLQVDRLSESASEASTLRDAKGRLLCGSGG